MAIIYGLKVNLSVTIVAMINHTSLDAAGHEEGHENLAISDNGELASDQCFDPFAKKNASTKSEVSKGTLPCPLCSKTFFDSSLTRSRMGLLYGQNPSKVWFSALTFGDISLHKSPEVGSQSFLEANGSSLWLFS